MIDDLPMSQVTDNLKKNKQEKKKRFKCVIVQTDQDEAQSCPHYNSQVDFLTKDLETLYFPGSI
jgi:hypothetical protein